MKKFRRTFLIFVVLFCFNTVLLAGNIRVVNVDEKTMGAVSLSLGRSTVLTFDSNPKKIIAGNANYFNIEFTGSDLTIQPLANVESNLFVYTENRRYGLILKPGNSRSYDDLVYIRWHTPIIKSKKAVLDYPKATKKDKFKIDVCNIYYEQERNLYLIDALVTNLSKKQIDLKKGEIWLSRNKQVIPILEKVFSKDKISYGEAVRVRVISRFPSKSNLSANFKFNSSTLKLVIKGTHL